MEEKSKAINLNDVKLSDNKPGDVKPDSEHHKEKSSKKDKAQARLQKYGHSKEAWESGIKVLETVDIVIPARLLHVCNQIAGKVRGDEFSILTNILEQDNDTITLSEEFYIPKQKVASTSIDYLPDTEASNYHVVIHRHPDGMNTFSSTDRNYINQNFQLSILYTEEGGFVNGVYNLKHNDYLIQIPVEIYIDYGLEEIDISNIEQERFYLPFKRRKSSYSRMLEPFEYDSWPKREKGNDDDKDKGDEKAATKDERKDEAKDKWSSGFDETEKALLPEENTDYRLMREMLLEDVNLEIEDLNQRVSILEDTVNYGIYGQPF